MRVLGIDYGTKRHGLAVSDPLGYTAQPAGLVQRQGGDGIDEIASVIEEKEVERIVLGLPFNMDGSPGDHHDEVLEFGAKLEERFGLPLETIDERLTTVQAERALQGLSRKKRKARVDQMAAQLILQAWLDSRQ
ncbi:MAG: Holliday junction resolvase RuvX [Planctomycetota bacterium]